jgi:hypothetical protein
MTTISAGRMILKRIHGWHPTAIGQAIIRNPAQPPDDVRTSTDVEPEQAPAKEETK